MSGIPSYWYLYVEYLNEILLLEVMWTFFKLMGNFEAMKIHTESKTFTALCSFIFSFSLKFISLKFLI